MKKFPFVFVKTAKKNKFNQTKHERNIFGKLSKNAKNKKFSTFLFFAIFILLVNCKQYFIITIFMLQNFTTFLPQSNFMSFRFFIFVNFYYLSYKLLYISTLNKQTSHYIKMCQRLQIFFQPECIFKNFQSILDIIETCKV